MRGILKWRQVHSATDQHQLIGVASAVTRDTEPWGVYTGVPAQKKAVPSTEAAV